MVTYRPRTLEEALNLLQDIKTIPFAGGTDLMVKYRSWAGTLPQLQAPVLWLGEIKELKGIHQSGDTLVIGSMETLASILASPAAPELLKYAIAQMASPSIRNMGTMGGNICNASPAGDTLPPLYVLDASVLLRSSAGERTLPIAEFITGPGKTALRKDELLTEIHIPIREYNKRYYRKVGTRKANALSKLSMAGLADIRDGVIEDVRIALGAVAPTVVRSIEAEKTLQGRNVKEIFAMIPEAITTYSELITPIDDQRSNAAYRKTVSLRLIEDFLNHLAD